MSITSLLLSYIPIYLGIALILFNKQITLSYEKFVKRNDSAFQKLITTTRISIGGVFLIAAGIWRLVEGSV